MKTRILNLVMTKNYIIILLITFTGFKGYSQDISGSWTWDESDKSFVIELEQINATSLSGFHTSVFQNGNRIDTFYDEKSVFLTKVSTNIFEGTIKSSYSLSTHKVRITFNPNEKSIEWWIYEVGSGQFYIPRKVKMFRIGDDPNGIPKDFYKAIPWEGLTNEDVRGWVNKHSIEKFEVLKHISNA